MTLRRPTLANIASAAGVSVATVSKVLNGREDVAPTTRALVEDLLQQHYYIGRSATRHPTVEILFHGPLTSYCMEVLEGMFPAAAEAGVAVVAGMGAPGGRPAAGPISPTAWARELAAAGRQAVITVTDAMSSEHVAALTALGVPLVVVDPIDLNP